MIIVYNFFTEMLHRPPVNLSGFLSKRHPEHCVCFFLPDIGEKAWRGYQLVCQESQVRLQFRYGTA